MWQHVCPLGLARRPQPSRRALATAPLRPSASAAASPSGELGHRRGDRRRHRHPLTADTGGFWFFGDQTELLVKVLDGRPVNGRFWVLWGGLTTVAYTFTVTDLATGERKEYHHPAGSLLGGNDIAAF